MASDGNRIPIIIDTDPGVDDCLALLLALASPELDILAIVVTFGNTGIDECSQNVLKIFHALEHHLASHPEDRLCFPNFTSSRRPMLVRGANGPLEGETLSAKYFHGRDGLANISNRHPEFAAPPSGRSEYLNILPSTADPYSFISQLVQDRPPRSVTYAALGPLTSLVNVCRHDKAFSARIGRVVAMGGALDVPGNTTPVAEFNCFADPHAYVALLTHPESPLLPIDRFTLLPLDITTEHSLPFTTYQTLVDPTFAMSTSKPSTHAEGEKKSWLVHFTSSVLEGAAEKMLSFGFSHLQLHDPLALWYCVCNPPGEALSEAEGWHVTKRSFEVERFGEHTRGAFVIDRRAGREAYGIGADRSQVEAAREKAGDQGLVHVPEVRGVRCVDATPGIAAMEAVLLERIWGVRKP